MSYFAQGRSQVYPRLTLERGPTAVLHKGEARCRRPQTRTRPDLSSSSTRERPGTSRSRASEWPVMSQKSTRGRPAMFQTSTSERSGIFQTGNHKGEARFSLKNQGIFQIFPGKPKEVVRYRYVLGKKQRECNRQAHGRGRCTVSKCK